jgi:hypothetical protein
MICHTLILQKEQRMRIFHRANWMIYHSFPGDSKKTVSFDHTSSKFINRISWCRILQAVSAPGKIRFLGDQFFCCEIFRQSFFISH